MLARGDSKEERQDSKQRIQPLSRNVFTRSREQMEISLNLSKMRDKSKSVRLCDTQTLNVLHRQAYRKPESLAEKQPPPIVKRKQTAKNVSGKQPTLQ